MFARVRDDGWIQEMCGVAMCTSMGMGERGMYVYDSDYGFKVVWQGACIWRTLAVIMLNQKEGLARFQQVDSHRVGASPSSTAYLAWVRYTRARVAQAG